MMKLTRKPEMPAIKFNFICLYASIYIYLFICVYVYVCIIIMASPIVTKTFYFILYFLLFKIFSIYIFNEDMSFHRCVLRYCVWGFLCGFPFYSLSLMLAKKTDFCFPNVEAKVHYFIRNVWYSNRYLHTSKYRIRLITNYLHQNWHSMIGLCKVGRCKWICKLYGKALRCTLSESRFKLFIEPLHFFNMLVYTHEHKPAHTNMLLYKFIYVCEIISNNIWDAHIHI